MPGRMEWPESHEVRGWLPSRSVWVCQRTLLYPKAMGSFSIILVKNGKRGIGGLPFPSQHYRGGMLDYPHSPVDGSFKILLSLVMRPAIGMFLNWIFEDHSLFHCLVERGPVS